MLIEKANVSDAEEILSLQKLAYICEAEIYNDFSIPPLIQILKEINEDFNKQFFIKIINNGKIIGSVRAYENDSTCYIGRLIVHPDFQNRGFGKKLMKAIESVFSQCKRYELFTGEKSTKNIRFYENCGYIVFKTEKVSETLVFVYLQKMNREKEGD